MKSIQSLIVLSSFLFSYSALAVVYNAATAVEHRLYDKAQILVATPHLSINDIKAVAGKCTVAGLNISNGVWKGSPCEAIYGTTPLSGLASTSGTGTGVISGVTETYNVAPLPISHDVRIDTRKNIKKSGSQTAL